MIEKSKLVPLLEIAEMDTLQRAWVECYFEAKKGYFDPETDQFTIAKKH